MSIRNLRQLWISIGVALMLVGVAVGQPDAGTLSNGAYSLTGGFWGGASAGGAPNVQRLYLPLILR